MRLLAATSFGGVTTFVLMSIANLNITDWKFWACFVPIAITGVIYANTKRN